MIDPVDLPSQARKIMRKCAAKHNTSFELVLNSVDSCPKKSPTFSSFGMRNFKNAINFHPEASSDEDSHCSPENDFVRNKLLKDSPYLLPKCCNMVSNIYKDRRSARKLKLYNLIKQIRKPLFSLEKEEPDLCETVITEEEYDKIPVKIVDEGYVVPDSDLEEDSSSVLVIDKDAESINEVCSGCSTLEETFIRKVKPKEKKKIGTGRQMIFVDPCAGLVRDLKAKQKNVRSPKCCH